MILHPEASTEFHEAALYYENREPGLGDRFVDAVESGFRQIDRNPFMWRRIQGDIRRYLVKTFPFGIIYAVVQADIFVLAVMQLNREPDYWLGRLADLPSPPNSGL